jgi:O-antigen/teichoic acid export membrane protein
MRSLPPAGRRLLADFAYLLTGHGFARLISVIATLYVTRALGPAEFGTLSLGVALAVVFGVCSNLGMDDLIARQVARDLEAGAALFADATVLKLLTLPAGAVGVLALSLVQPHNAPLYLFFFLYAAVFSHLLLLCALCRGQRRMALQSLLLGLNVLLVAAAAAAAAHLAGRAASVAAGYALAGAVALAAGHAVLWRCRALPRYAWRPARWWAVLRAALPFAATLFAILAFDRLALVAVGSILGDTAAGWFSAAANVVLGLTTVPGLAITAVYPVLARAGGERRGDAVGAVAAPLLLAVGGSGLALAAAVVVLAPAVVPRIFGAAYLPSIAILQTLALGLPGLFLALALISVLEAIDRPRAGAAAAGAGLLIAAPLYVVATHRWGAVGAAVAYDLTYTLLAVVTLTLVIRTVGWRHLRAWRRPRRRPGSPVASPAASPAARVAAAAR